MGMISLTDHDSSEVVIIYPDISTKNPIVVGVINN
jgi:hypothetical protein